MPVTSSNSFTNINTFLVRNRENSNESLESLTFSLAFPSDCDDISIESDENPTKRSIRIRDQKMVNEPRTPTPSRYLDMIEENQKLIKRLLKEHLKGLENCSELKDETLS